MIQKIKFFQIYLFFFCTAAFFSCTKGKRPNVDAINVDIKIERFDRDLFAGRTKPLPELTEALSKKYGQFYNDYVKYIIGNAAYSDSEMLTILFKDKAYADLTHETDSVFPVLDKYEQELTQTFKYIKHYEPKAVIPRFVSFISGFAYQNTVGEGYLSIGLDMFLGKHSKFYGAIVQSAPRYVSRRFSPEYLVSRTVETYLKEDVYPEPESAKNLLDKMLHEGKILYFMDQVLPENLSDTIKIGYTDKQLRWCQAYEKDIWGYFLENNLLYESNLNEYQVFLSDGPFTPGVGTDRESAPKLGIWIGWQIINAYMKNNPEITLPQLMAETDMQKILNKAKYRPSLKE